MRNVKNILASLVLGTMICVSSSFGGVYYTGKQSNPDVRPNECSVETVNTGVIIGGLTGVIIGGFAGVIIGGKSGVIIGGKFDTPCGE